MRRAIGKQTLSKQIGSIDCFAQTTTRTVSLYQPCHEKTDSKVFVIVILKEGPQPVNPSWYDNDKDLKVCFPVAWLIYGDCTYGGVGKAVSGHTPSAQNLLCQCALDLIYLTVFW